MNRENNIAADVPEGESKEIGTSEGGWVYNVAVLKANMEIPVKMRSLLIFLFVCAFATAMQGQDRHDWQSLAQLHPGDKIQLSLRTGPGVTAVFQTWTPEQVTAGTVTAKK